MSDKLKEKTVSGLKWSGLEKIFQQILVFGAGILLARKLFDTDYGQVAVLSIFTYMANALQDSGFPSALIRKRDANNNDYNTVFIFNTGVSLVLYLALFFSAPLISNFYDNQHLTPIARFIFLSFLFNGLAGVQSVQVIKAINYKKNAQINLTAIVISYSIALGLAYQNFGPWAIASQMVAYSAVRMVLLWITSKWRPDFQFSNESFKELFGFGSKLMVKSILDTTVTRITPNLIGKYFGFSPAGYYDQGNRLYSSGLDFLTGTVHNVAFPVLSSVEDVVRQKKIFRKLTRVVAFLTFPFFMTMILASSPFVLGVLGEKWEQSIPVIQLLALGGIFFSLSSTNMQMIKVKGYSSYLLYFEIVRLVLLIIGIIVTVSLNYSYLYIVLALTIINMLTYILNMIAMRKLIDYKLKQQLFDITPYLFIGLFSALASYGLSSIVEMNNIALLILRVLLAGGIYCLISYAAGSKVMKEALTLIKINKKNDSKA